LTYRPSYRAEPGGKPPTAAPDRLLGGNSSQQNPPNRATFWVARVAGRGSQTLTWSVKRGRWAIVVMRPDGSRAVTADLAAGAKLPALLWVSIVLLVLGIALLGGGAGLIYVGGREPRVVAAPSA
jgi:hypothetical protein